jgi:hypothetical protein
MAKNTDLARKLLADVDILYRDAIESRKSTGCVLCESRDFLNFHHIDPGSKDFEISDYLRNPEGRDLFLELKKCVILCSACHGAIHGKQPSLNRVKRPKLFYLLQEAAKEK